MKVSEASSRKTVARQSADKRKFVHESHVPEGALTWRSAKQRNVALWAWRNAVSREFAERPRCLRVAWSLDSLFGGDGFAFPADSWFERRIGLPVNKVQQALLALENGGAIIRASAIVDGLAQRRIWPSSQIIPPTVGGDDTPHRGMNIPPTVGGHTQYYKKNRSKSPFSNTLSLARRDAELREAKSQNVSWMRGVDAPAVGPAEPYPEARCSPTDRAAGQG